MSDERLTAKQFQQAAGAEDWRALAIGASAWFTAPSHTAGAALVRRVAELAESAGSRPDLDLRAGGVHVRIGAPDSPGFTGADLAVARTISGAAAELDLAADPSALQTMQLTIDALETSAVLPFWQAALRYEQVGEEDLVDPMRRDPGIWFQEQDAPRPLRNRIHVDVSRPNALPLDELESLGGRTRYVGDYYGTLADADGNEIDLIPADGLTDEPATADWRVLFGAMAFYPVTSAARAAELATAVAALADEAGLPLLIDLRPEGVTIDSGKDLWEDGRFGDLAGRVQGAARGMDLTADPSPLRFVQFVIDAVDVQSVRGFWRAVLGYEFDPRPGVTDIFDPRRLGPPVVFQQMSAHEQDRREQRNRIHVDVFVPDDRARAYLDAALAAGGAIVYDEHAPHWWTLADPEGNEVDIAVSVGR